MARRAAGEGSIHKSKDGRWIAWLDLGHDATGRRRRKKFEGQTRKVVAEKLAAARAAHEAGQDMAARPQALRVYLEGWLRDSVAPDARPRTVEAYRWAVGHALQHLPDVAVSKLSPSHCAALLATLARDGLAPKSRRLVYTALKQALAQAVSFGLLARNPMDKVPPPPAESLRGQTLTIEQARAFLAELEGEPYGLALNLALSFGLRRGEVAGLRWNDIDLDGRTLTINGTIQYIRGQGLIYSPAKTDLSRRTLGLSASLVAALRWHMERQRIEVSAMGWADLPYVFRGCQGGLLNPGRLWEALKRVAARAGLPDDFRTHDLRHSAASLMISNGEHPKVIAAVLGHANIQTTMDMYGHLLPGATDAAAGRLDALLRPSKDDDAGRQRRGA